MKVKYVEEIPYADYCIYVDTDSVFFSAKPIIEKTMPEYNINNPKHMIEGTRKVADKVQKVINKGYDAMSQRMFNIDPEKHQFEIKQELVSRKAIWIVKKRYVQWVVDEMGVSKDELDIKGLDVVRSSFPVKFRDFMYSKIKNDNGEKIEQGILVDFLKEAPKTEIDEKILTFRKEVGSYPVEEVARNTSVKEISKFEKEIKREPLGRFPKVAKHGKTLTFPAHIKAAINFNKFLKHHELDKDVEPITNGEKIKYVYLKNNEFGLKEIAFRGYRDPQILIDFVEKYSDGRGLYENELAGKLDDFYDALSWNYPSEGDVVINEFFSGNDTTGTAIRHEKKKRIKNKEKVNDNADEFFSF